MWTFPEQRARIGLLGCGDISEAYLRVLATSDEVRLTRCADLDAVRASSTATAWEMAASTVDELLAAPDVDVVLNLTPPGAHAATSHAALLAGKRVYSEKPLATTLDDATALVELAASRGLGVTSAPDTFLAEPVRVAARLLAEGAVGTVVGVSAAGMYDPPEAWHPDPRFLYRPGAGPLFDMGPYFLHALFALFGPVERVAASARTPTATRRIGSGPLAGTPFDAEIATHVAAVLQLHAGPTVSLQITFDAVASTLPMIEIQGAEGTMVLPDPETFDGGLRLFRPATGWTDVPLDPKPAHTARGAGLVELVAAAREGRPPLVGTDLGLHAVDVMEAVLDSAATGRFVPTRTSCARPDPARYPASPA